MVRDIDIAHLRSFVAVAEHGSMTRAAGMRHLTQSAISQQIKRLETQLGCELFRRSASVLSLTRDGIRLLPRAQRSIQENDALFAFMTDTQFEGTLRLGVPHDVVASMLPETLSAFHSDNPDVLVTLVSGPSRYLTDELAAGRIDMAITTDRDRDRDALYLQTDQLVWIGASKGRAHLRDPLSVAIGPGSCPFSRAAIEALDMARRSWRPISQTGSLEPVFATLLSDMAVAPFLSWTVPAGLRIIKAGLPTLPEFHLHLRVSDETRGGANEALANAICEGLRR